MYCTSVHINLQYNLRFPDTITKHVSLNIPSIHSNYIHAIRGNKCKWKRLPLIWLFKLYMSRVCMFNVCQTIRKCRQPNSHWKYQLHWCVTNSQCPSWFLDKSFIVHWIFTWSVFKWITTRRFCNIMYILLWFPASVYCEIKSHYIHAQLNVSQNKKTLAQYHQLKYQQSLLQISHAFLHWQCLWDLFWICSDHVC